ncbi:MAG TPA: FixG Ig-like domain-containing protein, partial [Steroidobacteraceae bacterium]|nr:FixG Ig-like domain-containing protein [Steroidobacteraceae bacterium]
IRYTTEEALHGHRTRIVRPRMVVYAGLLLIICILFVYSLASRTPLILDVIRDRNALYREVQGDFIENTYSLKVINLDSRAHAYRLTVSGLAQLQIAEPAAPIFVPAGTVATVAARLQAPAAVAVGGVHQISVTLTTIDDTRVSVLEKARFIGPPS